MRAYANTNPIGYAFNNLRCNAKRRGHEFAITLSEFREFCEKNGYIESKGRTKECLSIDRIDNDRGYFIDNIQVMTVSDNSIKADRKSKWLMSLLKQELIKLGIGY